MPNFKPPRSNIHLIARAFLTYSEEVVLCRVKGKDWFFLPGGHVENGESSMSALLRELNEEIGPNDYYVSSFIGVCENIFFLNENTLQHEVNMIFKVDLGAGFEVANLEEDIEFVMVKKQELKNIKMLPGSLKEGILEWKETGKPFFKQLR